MSDAEPITLQALAHAVIADIFASAIDHDTVPHEIEGWAARLLLGEPIASLRAAIRLQVPLAGHLVDPEWYCAQYPDVVAAGADPQEHYRLNGQAERRTPNAYFNPLWYVVKHGLPDTTDTLLHYLQQGEAAALAPSANFEPAWYRQAHDIPPDQSALAHFLRHRRDGQVAPSRLLWAALGIPRPAGNDPFAPFVFRGEGDDAVPFADLALLRDSGLFDANHYCLCWNDVLTAGIDPLEHFCRFGWKEGRNPCFYFDTSWYLETNPDAAALGVNPLSHYLLKGEPAGRRPVVFFDPAWYRAHYAVPIGQSPLAHYLRHRNTQEYSPVSLFDPSWYLAHTPVPVPPRRDPFSHYLMAGMQHDVSPSPDFDAAAWRRRTRGRPSRHFQQRLTAERDNPLVSYLLTTYR